jgi:hypothetical protein
MEVIAWRWFNGGTGTVGIVQCSDPYEGPLYFIGSALTGMNEEADVQHIARWGARFPNEAADVLFGV